MSLLRDHKIVRILLIVLSQFAYFAALIINALAGPGKGPFQRSTGNISDRYQTEITPAGWTFSIWGVIYSWLFLMNAYILTWLCRGYFKLHTLHSYQHFAYSHCLKAIYYSLTVFS